MSVSRDSRWSAEVLVFPSFSPDLKVPPADTLFPSNHKYAPESGMGITLEAVDAIF